MMKRKVLGQYRNGWVEDFIDLYRLPTDDEVVDAILSVPAHFSNTYFNSVSSTGTCTVTAASAPQVCWNCTSISVSQAGPTVGPNAQLQVWDGAIGTGTVIFTAFLTAPGGGYGGGVALGGSVGVIQDIPLPKDGGGRPCLQATPGNAMNIQVTGTGANKVSINARMADGLSQ